MITVRIPMREMMEITSMSTLYDKLQAAGIPIVGKNADGALLRWLDFEKNEWVFEYTSREEMQK